MRQSIQLSSILMVVAFILGSGTVGVAAESSAATDADALVARLEQAEMTYDRKELLLLIDAFTGLVEQQPARADYLYRLARSYFPLIDLYDTDGLSERAEQEGEKGLEYARQSVELDPEGNPDAHRLLGDFYGRLTNFKGVWTRIRYGGESNKLHTKALAMDADNPRAVIGVGTDKLYAPSMFGGDVEGAAELFKQAVEMLPESAMPHVWLSRAYSKLDRPELARQELQAALALEPASGLARIESAATNGAASGTAPKK